MLLADFGGAVDADSILEFVDDGRDVLIAIDSRASEELRGLISDFGVDVEPKGTAVVDHIQYVQSSDVVDHTVVGSKEFGAIEGLFGSKPPEVRHVDLALVVCKMARIVPYTGNQRASSQAHNAVPCKP